MRRSPLTRRIPLRVRSPKRARLMRERRALVVRLLEERKMCEILGCLRAAEHAHERKTRARGGSILDENNILVVCALHHAWIHDHPADAAELGLLTPSWGSV